METIISKERENFRNENVFPYLVILPGATPEKWLHPGGSDGKESPAVWETWVRSLDWEDPLEEGMAAHASILAWRIPQTEKPDGLQSTGSQRVGNV